MTTALIFAGGTGQRMNARSRPKQFLELHGKPIIIYTIEHFEIHPKVDNIIVVCVENWIPRLNRLIRHYELEKIIKIIPGGSGADRSVYKGLHALENICKPDDIVLIHDGVRPLINAELITNNIETARQYGCAITVEPASETIVRVDNNDRIDAVPKRSEMYVAKAPQTFKYGLIWDIYQRTMADGKWGVDSASLCHQYGIKLHTVRSTPSNIKITTPTDYFIFRALFEAMENEQILGIKPEA